MQRLETCGIGFGMPQPLYVPLKSFQCILPSQNQQNVKFLGVSLNPLTKTEKKCQFEQA